MSHQTTSIATGDDSLLDLYLSREKSENGKNYIQGNKKKENSSF
ncbi:8159_t:CDS:2 [Entrophospora sp. SA101]|nr:8159_t:CDS:2 [Entrophospora sp. SA101]CAJ0839325.1 14539_t:CDS:2 [Entrophospora sp. SA101]CAJ0846781.1 18676_t:CDS:2 [Entrophospora sp. SA101]